MSELTPQERKRQYRKVNRRFKKDEVWWAERSGQELLGHKRRGLSYPDAKDDMFSTEVRGTKQKLAFIEKLMLEAEDHATQTRTPLAVIFRTEYDRSQGYVIYRVKDWLDLYGQGENG